MPVSLTPLGEAAEQIRKDAEESIVGHTRRAMDSARRQIQTMESTRRAIALLEAAGVEVEAHGLGLSAAVSLGFFPSSKRGNARLARRVRAVRRALGCRLEQRWHGLDDARRRTVDVTLAPVDFPEVSIRFKRTLPRGSKCKIVRQRSTYHTLVCER